MKLLLVASHYPLSTQPFWGVPNERAALALRELGTQLVVLAPRPYAPPVLSALSPRWNRYRLMAAHESRNGIDIYRPSYLQIPRIGSAIWNDPGTFIFCRRTVAAIFETFRFEAVLSFDLMATGGIAWRVGRMCGVPAAGWAIGGDIHLSRSRSHRSALLRAITHLDVVFYQSRDLMDTVVRRFALESSEVSPGRHMVLPRGVPEPPAFQAATVRGTIRAAWGIAANEVVVINVGRITRDKGVFELLEAMRIIAGATPDVVCVFAGSVPALDETRALETLINRCPRLRRQVRVVPATSPERVWEYLAAADIFAFPSRREGMPNSLLEAMMMQLPAVGFAIPPVVEIEGGTGCLIAVPDGDANRLAEEILRLVRQPNVRTRVAQKGRDRVREHFALRSGMSQALRRLADLVADHEEDVSHRVPSRSDL
jgi:teichuronic acid biosynthesis glycosyltransferase TuaC